MKSRFLRHERARTVYVQLDARKCKACWKCIDTCPNKVIGKIDFLGHRHVRIDQSDKCSGCLKCVKTCESGAYNSIASLVQQQ
jgi:2-oxoglutarate ferredoxin oxidoreductase subunit delta